MKVGRNDPCPCGSGKKYKKCCLRKTDEQRLAEAIVNSNTITKKERYIKQCLHPNQDECRGGIIKAHAIQNNRILRRIAENGHVITLDGTSNLIFQDAQTKGRKIATVFTGFCSYHDKVLFQDIEDRDFTATAKQIFLLTYRTMSWHYHKKQEQDRSTQVFIQNMAARGFELPDIEESRLWLKGLELGLSDNAIKKNEFDDALLNNKYDSVCYCIWELPYEVHFAVSMQYEPSFDILGNPISDYESDEYLPSIFLNIFPAEGKSFCIWSWLATDNDVFCHFAEQFMALAVVDRENYLNNKLPAWTDSIVISPTLWNKWGENIQQALITHANFGGIFQVHEIEDGGHPYEYMDTPWNLFEPLAADNN